MVGGLTGGLIGGLIFGLDLALVGGLVGSLVFGLVGALEKQRGGGLQTKETLKWNWAKLKEIKVILNILIFGLFGGLFGGLIGGLVVVFGDFVIGFGDLVVGLIFGLVVGLIFGLEKELSEVVYFSHLNRPYQRLSGIIKRDIILWATIISVLIFGLAIFYNGSSIEKSLLLSPMSFVSISVFMLLYSPLFQFIIINYLLKIESSLPFPMAKFFNYLVDKNILEKDGGFWRFRHQIIHDYFLEEEQNE